MNPSLYYTTLAIIIYFSIALLTTIALAADTEAATYQYVSYRPIATLVDTTTTPWDTSRWHSEQHPEPAQFTITETGEVYGITMTGVPFTQVNVPNDFGIRAQRFSIQNHSHLILNGEAIYDLQEFSVRLYALAASQAITLDPAAV